MIKQFDRKIWLMGLCLCQILGLFGGVDAMAAPYRVVVLTLGDIRQEPVAGLRDGLKELGYAEGDGVIFKIETADGQRERLAALADSLVKSQPDVAIAAGGVEADALKAATAGTNVPVVFLAVASSVERGLVASLAKPGGNLTGVDTNDTELTAKRLWFVRKMLPGARRVLIPSIPGITPSTRSLEVAQIEAPNLNLEILVLEGADKEAVAERTRTFKLDDVDAIYLGPVAPLQQIQESVFWPLSLNHGTPIMGVNRGDLARGAIAAYACSRYDTGKQSARLVQKIFKGGLPADIPVETPSRLEFVINRWVVERLDLSLPKRVWRLADEVVSIAVE